MATDELNIKLQFLLLFLLLPLILCLINKPLSNFVRNTHSSVSCRCITPPPQLIINPPWGTNAEQLLLRSITHLDLFARHFPHISIQLDIILQTMNHRPWLDEWVIRTFRVIEIIAPSTFPLLLPLPLSTGTCVHLGTAGE